MSTSQRTSGYDAVMDIAGNAAAYLCTIRACYDWIARQEAKGDDVLWVDEKWIEMSTGRTPRTLRKLADLGVLEEKFFYDERGRRLPNPKRVYYFMPDRSGVGRALEELGVPPTVFL
jgi:hypothetical protein